ncbi:lysM and putative peptidoglycan-binding domain-containing protein 1 [Schistocerca cancellata]|uniref:lysM and putative peptidoglycan-binding domain-containing protein 1 n=1 Tax=Schistocerca cancellata TaxID=274614 RepID=UPI0021174323|nr:lysM and putative peptidoglycan-binding domain-containing protein 1 [Schistocerca cancellata]
MASSTTDEKQSIRESAKQPKKYGSFCNHVSRQDNCIKHIIVEGDTLQGIALKYGVTMEQIRRLNRLWATDSLFLREYLLIPVPADKALSASQSSTDVNPARSPGSPDSTHSEERSINDFLVHIDNSIANMKSQVKKTQGNSEFCSSSDDDMFGRRRTTRSRLRQQQFEASSGVTPMQGATAVLTASSQSHNDVLSMPQTLVMTQGRKVRSSLQRLQKEQDEMFEL